MAEHPDRNLLWTFLRYRLSGIRAWMIFRSDISGFSLIRLLCPRSAALAILMSCAVSVAGQESQNVALADPDSVLVDTLTAAEVAKFDGQVRELISYLKYNLNLLGSDSIPIREKDIIITASYLKLFRDAKVQIEDDLDQNRVLVTNKDVQAYLKDVHFFFKDVRFDFVIDTITYDVAKDGTVFFKVSMNRTLSGINLKGDTVSNEQIRFVELNLDRESENLKIVSIYTKGLSAEDDLKFWWNEMPPAWKDQFKMDVYINDSLTVQMAMERDTDFEIGDTILLGKDTIFSFNQKLIRSLKQLTNRTSVDVSSNARITGLEPLKKFSRLKVLDLSSSGVTNLEPLRNLSGLLRLDISNTSIKDLGPLKYCTKMKEFYFDRTRVNDISVVANFTDLEKLYAKRTEVSDLRPLSNLLKLEVLQLSFTPVRDVSPLSGVHRLNRLYLDSTQINDIKPLSSIQNLEILSIEKTAVSDLSDLINFNRLQKIFCRDIAMDKEALVHFSITNPDLVVVFAPDELIEWWNGLSFPWQQAIKKKLEITSSPTSEELHRVLKIEEIDVSGNKEIDNLNVLRALFSLNALNISGTSITALVDLERLTELERLDVSQTGISDISALEPLKALKNLDLSNTNVTRIRSLEKNEHLEMLKISGTSIADISVLSDLPELKTVYAENIKVARSALMQMDKRSTFLFVYRTGELETWWERLPGPWKEVLKGYVPLQKEIPNELELHRIGSLPSVSVNDRLDISDLSQLWPLIKLRSLHLSKTSVSNLAPLEQMSELVELRIENSPVEDAEAVAGLINLERLELNNTSINSIQFVESLTKLEVLSVSGTRIKNIKAVAALQQLKSLNVANTFVKSLKPVMEVPYLETLICFNTKVTDKCLNTLREEKPALKIEHY